MFVYKGSYQGIINPIATTQINMENICIFYSVIDTHCLKSKITIESWKEKH
jgi:hypothetical protein